MNELKPRQLSTVLWAMGRMRAYPGIEIMETLVTRARTSLAEHDPQVCMLCKEVKTATFVTVPSMHLTKQGHSVCKEVSRSEASQAKSSQLDKASVFLSATSFHASC